MITRAPHHHPDSVGTPTSADASGVEGDDE